MKRLRPAGTHYQKSELIELFRQYSQQIRKDRSLRHEVVKKLRKFAPFKPGDKVYYKLAWMDSVRSKPQFPGEVIYCDYVEHEQFNRGVWQVCVQPRKKDFTVNNRHLSMEYLPVSCVRLAKE